MYHIIFQLISFRLYADTWAGTNAGICFFLEIYLNAERQIKLNILIVDLT